jgi:hypothetical protein
MLRRFVLSVSGHSRRQIELSKNVMGPMNERRLRIDVEGSMVKPQIVTIVGSQHQAVTKQADRIAVPIFRGMYDVNPSHGLSLAEI